MGEVGEVEEVGEVGKVQGVSTPMAVDPNPNLWSIQRDDAKTLITLGTAVLGVSTTFGKSFLAPNGSASIWLLIAWLAIAGSILAAVLGSAGVFNRLKGNAFPKNPSDIPKKPGGIVSFFLNASFFLLVFGLVTLAVVAHANWRT